MEKPPDRGDSRVTDSGVQKPAPRRLELVFGPDSIPPAAPESIPATSEKSPAIAPPNAPPAPSAAPSTPSAKPIASTQPVPFEPTERRMIRSLAGWIGLTGIASMVIGVVCAAQWALGRGNVASAMLVVLSFAIGLWNIMAGFHLGRVIAKGHRDAHQLVRAFSHLRSIFILRAIALFLALALSCFAFSILASFLALVS